MALWFVNEGGGAYRHGQSDIIPEGAKEVEDQKKLDALIAAAEADFEKGLEVKEIETNGFKIWSLAPKMVSGFGLDDPSGLDYKRGLTVRLHPKREIVKGELMSVEYYRYYDGIEFDELIVRVDLEWIRDENGLLKRRNETRQWATSPDGELAGENITTKFYNPKEAAIADARRRNNIVEDLTAQAENFGALSYVQTMFRSLDNELNTYVKTGDKKFLEKIGTYSGAWLDAPQAALGGANLRQVIVGALTL